MYYEYQHQDGMMTEWLTCDVVDPKWENNKIHIKYKLGHDEYDVWVPINKVRLVYETMETSQ